MSDTQQNLAHGVDAATKPAPELHPDVAKILDMLRTGHEPWEDKGPVADAYRLLEEHIDRVRKEATADGERFRAKMDEALRLLNIEPASLDDYRRHAQADALDWAAKHLGPGYPAAWGDPFGEWTADQRDAAVGQKRHMCNKLRGWAGEVRAGTHTIPSTAPPQAEAAGQETRNAH